jgi:hypothetical protein
MKISGLCEDVNYHVETLLFMDMGIIAAVEGRVC